MNVKDVCLKKNTVRRKRMYVCPIKPVIENDSKKELQPQNANEMHQTMKNCKKPIKQHRGQRKVHRLPKKPNLRKEAEPDLLLQPFDPDLAKIVLPVHLFLFNSGKVRPAVQTAAVCQSIHRLPHNKCVPLFYSLLRCRTVLHRLHSLQSTVLPIQPDSSRLLTM